MDRKAVTITDTLSIGGDAPLLFIAGPCVIESEDLLLEVAEALAKIADEEALSVVFKASFDKANRTALASYRGPGLDEGLEILSRVRARTGLPILSDIHTPSQADPAAQVLDVLQIPAFLCRQTDLLVAAGKTGKPVNVKKGQFLSPWDMGHVVEKVNHGGSDRVLLTERGSSFGYNNLVADMRSIPAMQSLGTPVVFDATHSVQLPGGQGDRSGGMADMIPPLARAAVAAGADGVFAEVHPRPGEAKSDGPNSLPLKAFRDFAKSLTSIHAAARG